MNMTPSRSHDYLDPSGSFRYESSIVALSYNHREPLPGSHLFLLMLDIDSCGYRYSVV
jgi:hypothetical protein